MSIFEVPPPPASPAISEGRRGVWVTDEGLQL